MKIIQIIDEYLKYNFSMLFLNYFRYRINQV